MQKNQKYCVNCKTWKPIENFALDGKDRFDEHGNLSRRRLCSACVWKHRKEKSKTETEKLDSLVNALVELGRHNLDRVGAIEEDEFVKRTKAHEYIRGLNFEDIKEKAVKLLHEHGYHRPESGSMPPGTYLIVGDSHGKHTKSEMFQLLKVLNKELHVDKIIHVGHLLDDDNDINIKWNEIENLLVISKTEETKRIEEALDECNFDFNIVRNELQIGKFFVCNQEIVQDYVKTFIGNLDPEIFPESTITNCHRHEMDTRCSFNGRTFVLSPGCLCEQHIVKTIKQIDFTSGYQVRLSYPDGYIKYRRMKHMYKFWQKGAIVVNFDGETTTCVPIRIKEINGKFVTSYFDKIIDHTGSIHLPEEKIFANADIHADLHDDDILDIQDQVCKDYLPTKYVNLGDMYNCSSLNHHYLDKGQHVIHEGDIIDNKDVLQEMALINFLFKKMGKWADDKYILYGNHERFMRDFVSKYPQLRNLLDFIFLSGLRHEGYNFLDLKDVLQINNLNFLHGDMKMYGQKGRRTEKASRTFKDCVMGHIHYPSIRFNAYTVGLTGKLDHYYNEKNASNWTHGFFMCNQYKGENFSTTVVIENNKILLNSKLYESNNSEFSHFTTNDVKIEYGFEEEGD